MLGHAGPGLGSAHFAGGLGGNRVGAGGTAAGDTAASLLLFFLKGRNRSL